MPAGYIKPLVIRIIRSRIRYRIWGLMEKDLPVILYDSKGLIVGDSEFVRCYRVLWKDIKLIESEKVIQTQVINNVIDNSKTIEKRRGYVSMFKPKLKTN
jgi:uncharacterized Fe-S cluster-containing protein